MWVVGTVLWVMGISNILYEEYKDGRLGSDDWSWFFGVPLFFWFLLYMGFWVSSGFSSDKKKDETNE